MRFRLIITLSIILTLSIASLTIHEVYADEFTYCLENSTHSQGWQKPSCFESVKCDVSIPIILFDNDDLDFEYYIQLVQYKTL